MTNNKETDKLISAIKIEISYGLRINATHNDIHKTLINIQNILDNYDKILNYNEQIEKVKE